MERGTSVYAALILAIVVGLAIVVYAEATTGNTTVVLAGGVISLAAVGVLAAIIARLPEPDGANH